MEQDPLKSKIKEVSDQQVIEEMQQNALETQQDIDHLLKSLKYFFESLERHKDNLENPKELLNTEQRNEIREKILKTKKIIKEIHDRMNALALDKIKFMEQLEVFEDLEREHNEIFLEIIDEKPANPDDFKEFDDVEIPNFSKEKLN